MFTTTTKWSTHVVSNTYSRVFWAHVKNQMNHGINLHDLHLAFKRMTGRDSIRAIHFAAAIVGRCASTRKGN